MSKPKTTLANNTGKKLRIHLFKGTDDSRLIAYAERDLKIGEEWKIDSAGRNWWINVWGKGGGALGMDVHWKNGIKVVGQTLLSGLGSNVVAEYLTLTDFDLLTLNVHLMPFPAPGCSEFGDNSYGERLDAIAKLADDYTVVALQEVWRSGADGHYLELLSRLKGCGFDQFYRGEVKPTLALGFNHGLLIASKFPFTNKAEICYRDTAAGTWDALAEKGALHVAMDVEGSTVHLFNTHLQAQASGVDARKLQLAQLHEFVQSQTNGVSRVVLAGDFNIQRESPERESPEYSDWWSEDGDWMQGFTDLVPTDWEHRSAGKGLDYFIDNLFGSSKAVTPQTKYLLYDGSDICLSDATNPRPVTDHPAVFSKKLIG